MRNVAAGPARSTLDDFTARSARQFTRFRGGVRIGARRLDGAIDFGLRRGLVALGPGVAWATLGTVSTQGSTLASNVFIANILGKPTFGEFALVLTTVQAAASLAGLGLGYTATRYLAGLRHTNPDRAGQLLGLLNRLSWVSAITGALLLGAASSGLAAGFLDAPALGPFLMLAAASAVFTVRSGFLVGALTGLEAFRSIGWCGVIAGTTYLVLTVVGAWTDGVRGAAFGLCGSAVVQCALLSAALHVEGRRRALKGGFARFSEERSLLLRFALPAALSGLSTVPVLWSVQALLARRPGGFGELADYFVGLNLLAMVLFVPVILNSVAMAWLNRTQSESGDAGYRSALVTSVSATLITVTAAIVVMAIIGPALLGLFGHDFRAGYGALALLLAAAFPEALTVALHQSLQTRERMWEAFFAINIPRDLVIVGIAIMLIPRMGAIGAATAYLSGRLVAAGSMLYLVRHDLRAALGHARQRVVTE